MVPQSEVFSFTAAQSERFYHGDRHLRLPTTCRYGTQSGILLRWLSPSLFMVPSPGVSFVFRDRVGDVFYEPFGVTIPPLRRIGFFSLPSGILRLLSPSVFLLWDSGRLRLLRAVRGYDTSPPLRGLFWMWSSGRCPRGGILL